MDAFVFKLTLLSQVVFYDALAVTANFTSVPPEIRERTQASSSSAIALEQDESRESEDRQHSNLIERMDDNIQDKLDELDNRMNDVNNNMEMLKKKFDLLSANENYVNQKLFNFEAGMNDRLEKLDNSMKQRMDNLEDEMKQQLANLKRVSVENAKGIPLGSTLFFGAKDTEERNATNPTTVTTTERNDAREATNKSLDTLLKWMNHNMEDKFYQMGKKMTGVNRNVEVLKQEFETLSLKEKTVDQKLDTLENGVGKKISAMEGDMSKKLEDVRLRAQEPFTSATRQLDSMEASLGGKITKKFFLLFNILWVPFVTLACQWIEPTAATLESIFTA